MPSASIQSLVNGVNPIIGASREDVVVGDVVTVSSVNTHTTYSWTLAYKPVGSSAVFSGSSTASSPGSFTVDMEGPYLVRLTADLGLGTESIQYVRIRYPTVLGQLTLSAAGEGYGGAIPVPVDQTPTGWTDALNNSLITLLNLIGRTAFSSNMITVDPTEGYGDYQTVQAAIDAAVADGATSVNPFVVLVHPGLYIENVTFAAGVYVFGCPVAPAGTSAYPVVQIRGAHVVSTPGGADHIVVGWLTLINTTSSTNASVQKTGSGTADFHECVLDQSGLNVLQGPAIRVDAGSVSLVECRVVASSSLADDRAAITTGANTSLTVARSEVAGPTGLVLNAGLGAASIASLHHTSVTGSGVTGFAVVSDAVNLDIIDSTISSANSVALTIHPGAGVFASDQIVSIRRSNVSGDISFDVTGIAGATGLSLGSSEYGSLTFPGGAPATNEALTVGTSLFYDNTTTGMAAVNVQDAIDETHAEATLVRTLDDAYNGGVPLSGGGRTIYASAGSVQILDAVFPSDPPPAGNTDAQLEIVSAVRVGSVGFPEIDVDPNPYGKGPSIVMGNRVVPGNIPFGAGTATLMGRSTGSALFRNYNLRLQTQSSDGGGAIGRLVLMGGDALENGGSTPDAASVYIQAGSAFHAAGSPGSVFLVPGTHTGGAQGDVVFASLDGATPATLTAAGTCADPIGVDGSITFATDMGAITLTVAASDTRAAVVAALDSLEGVSAAQAAGIITITTDALGPNAEIYFLSASTGVDSAIGGFDGQVMVAGTFASTLEASVTAAQEISFGTNGATGPLVYNADTGKLTVPGLIDPTAIVFEEAPAPSTGATEGAVFVSDGSSGLVLGDLYYRGPSDAVPVNISSPSGATPTLAAVLAVGNVTGGTSIVLTSSDELVGEGGSSLAANMVLRGGTATGGGATDGGVVHLRPGAGFGGGADGIVQITNAADTEGVRITIPSADTVSIDALAGGGLPLVYDASSGKLTVPGLIDPTGLVLTQAAAPATGAAEGALFVSDGSGGLTAGVLYFRAASSGTSSPITGGAFVFPMATVPAQTAEGSAVWDTNDDLLTVGTGASRKTMVDTDSAQVLTNKTLSGQQVVSFTSKAFGDSPYAVASTDYVILYDPTGGNSTVNLPSAASSSGRVLNVKHSSVSGNTVTIDGNAAETIDGSLTLVLNSFQSAVLLCDGSNWYVL